VQFPRPPIILGGSGKARSAALAARYADEYNVGFKPADQTRTIHDGIRSAVADYGREADTMTYSAALTIATGATEAQAAQRARATGFDLADLRRDGLAGTAAEVVDKIADYARIGVDTLYLQVFDMRDIAHLEFIAAQVAPQFPD
jgi:alkanesulfonate monooxygenase SsuD/methylene tetrahydromethanopterin reductase-like flavin-dependent oxidoreductase (luciferase family)